MLNSISVVSVIIGIFLDAIIFNILYSTMNKDYGNLINALIYAVGMSIKLLIITRVKLTFILSFGTFFLVPVAIYFVIGLALMQILNKLYDHLIDRVTFTIASILMQIGMTTILYYIMSLNLFLI